MELASDVLGASDTGTASDTPDPGHATTSPVFETEQGTLLRLLTNSLILAHITPNLPPSSILRLAATSRAYRSLLYSSPSTFRFLDLSRIQPNPEFGHQRLHLTEDEDSSPSELVKVFDRLRRVGWLSSIQTLILDKTDVTAEFVHELLINPELNVRILSLHNTPLLNKHALQNVLRTVCRRSRPSGTPRLKGLYLLGPQDSLGGPVDLSYGYYHAYEDRKRNTYTPLVQPWLEAWADTLVDCAGVLAFDAVLCRGPRHPNSPAFGRVPGFVYTPPPNMNANRSNLSNRPYATQPDTSLYSLATVSAGGCKVCGSAPEGWTVWGEDASASGAAADAPPCPLLWPPPRYSSNIRLAMCPLGGRLDQQPAATVEAGRGRPAPAPPTPELSESAARAHAKRLELLHKHHPKSWPGSSRPFGEAELARLVRFVRTGRREELEEMERYMGTAQFDDILTAAWGHLESADPSGHRRADGDQEDYKDLDLFEGAYYYGENDEPAGPFRFIARCEGCLYNRMCRRCGQWTCEACEPDSKSCGVINGCIECGQNCPSCIALVQRRCKGCRQTYCVEHNSGSTATHCDCRFFHHPCSHLHQMTDTIKGAMHGRAVTGRRG